MAHTLAVFGCPNWTLIKGDLLVISLFLSAVGILIGSAWVARSAHRAIVRRSPTYDRFSDAVGETSLPFGLVLLVGGFGLWIVGSVLINLYRRWFGC